MSVSSKINNVHDIIDRLLCDQHRFSEAEIFRIIKLMLAKKEKASFSDVSVLHWVSICIKENLPNVAGIILEITAPNNQVVSQCLKKSQTFW